MTLHILIADIKDKFTNSSSECLRILNRFGICCSKDSLKRFQTDIIEKKFFLAGIQLSPESFTICSIDNINKRSSYAYAKAGDKSRGFDSTSVQLVEPRPERVKWHENEKKFFPSRWSAIQK